MLMRDLNFQLKWLCRRSHDGSYQTRANRHRILQMIADQLHEMSYQRMQAKSLKPKHVEALVQRWQSENIAIGTIKNRMAMLRWWAEKVGKSSVIAGTNEHYGIENRCFVSSESKAKTLTAEMLDRVPDPYVRMSLELQQAFGLRREEAIKFCPAYADLGNRIRLKSSWTKGGKAREVPIWNDLQREVLDRAHRLAGRQSLIPEDRSYFQQLRLYERQTANAGLSKLHGLRHRYAQERYRDLAGWSAPAAGGPSRDVLTPAQRKTDLISKTALSLELGHERRSILSVYLGQ